MRITNEGRDTAYFPGDAGTVALKSGETVDVRLGVADYAVRNVPGVRFAESFDGQAKGVSEASVEAAVQPIAEHVSEDPGDTRYAVVGDVPGSTDVTVVPGSPEDHVTPAATGEEQTDGDEREPWDLKGAELDEALDGFELPKTGTADEKRARLREALENL
jgi:hypothetical protein